MKHVDGYKERIVYVDDNTVKCSGDNADHPLTYYKIPHDGFVVCKYCDIKFARKEKDL